MGKTLTEIAQELKNSPKKVQLIYAFNGTGKTRLSRAFKELVSPKHEEEEAQDGDTGVKVLYYNAFTEDLFYWDNDLEKDTDRKLVIRPNAFTDWVLEDEGQDRNIITNFQHYTNDKLTPCFNEGYNEVSFSIEGGNEERIDNIKISRGEESCFIWCVFYSLLKEVVEVLNVPEPENRSTNKFDDLEYFFIDDPVSSLDDNHLIELAVDVAELIKSSQSNLKFIITTHNPLFYNVLFNAFNNADSRYSYSPRHSVKKRLEKLDDGTFLPIDTNDSPFSYHLALLTELNKAILSDDIQKYHYNFLRNILEKTATFLGYKNWGELLPAESREAYCRRINLYSHSKHSGEESSIVKEEDKRVLTYLVKEVLIPQYHFHSIVDHK